MNYKKINRRFNIHTFVLLGTLILFACLDTFNIYTPPTTLFLIYLFGYPIYIVLSTFYLINKNYNINHDKLKDIHSWSYRREFKMKLDEIERQMKEQDMKKK